MTIRQLKALRHYSAQLALAVHAANGSLRYKDCGCVYRRLPPVGGITEAYAVVNRCQEHA